MYVALKRTIRKETLMIKFYKKVSYGAESDRFNKTAFTLAEVLITLGIIGIIAAMTLPAVITKYRKKQTAAVLKETYSLLNQAVMLSENTNGSKEYWDFTLSSENFYKTYLQKYLKHSKEYFGETSFNNIKYECLKGNCYQGAYAHADTPKIALQNGTILIISNHEESDSILIYADINGMKKPNIRGIDMFLFNISKTKGVVPYGYEVQKETSENYLHKNATREEITDAGANASCNLNSSGNWCAALIMYDGWEIKDDYPWR